MIHLNKKDKQWQLDTSYSIITTKGDQQWKGHFHNSSRYRDNMIKATIFIPPRNRGGVIFSLQFFCVSVCLGVCVCVCVCLCVRHFLWTKLQPNGCTDLDAVFVKWLLLALAQTLLNLVTLSQWSRSQWRNTHFFLHNSLLTSLPCISALLCLIKMKFGMSLRYTFGRFVLSNIACNVERH